VRVQKGDGIRLIPVEEVYYFKASDKYTTVITKDGESLIRKPIKELADELDPQQFWRIHRGTIVNVQYVDQVSRSVTGRGVVRLKDRPETLAISRQYIHLFKQM
jgi:DNA-binding LytR/AlgR family response regulator